MAVEYKKIFEAIEKNDLEVLKELSQSADFNSNCCDENGMTLLMQAAYKGELEICKYLLSRGAEVDKTDHQNSYTALMMSALSGSSDVVSFLLENGADTEVKNSIGKTAANLAAFTGQQDCLNLLRNYLSYSKLHPYATEKLDEGNLLKFPLHLIDDIRCLVMLSNPHPVNMILFLKDHSQMMSADNLQRIENCLSDLCQKCHRTKQDYDEILAIKLHYISSVIKRVRVFFESSEKAKLDKLIKKMLHADGNGFPVAIETFIRQTMRDFPFVELPAFQQFVTTIAATKIGKDPTSISCLIDLFNGLRASTSLDKVCSTCGANNSPLRCGVCKKVYYCAVRCQKLHWSTHKLFCKAY